MFWRRHWCGGHTIARSIPDYCYCYLYEKCMFSEAYCKYVNWKRMDIPALRHCLAHFMSIEREWIFLPWGTVGDMLCTLKGNGCSYLEALFWICYVHWEGMDIPAMKHSWWYIMQIEREWMLLPLCTVGDILCKLKESGYCWLEALLVIHCVDWKRMDIPGLRHSWGYFMLNWKRMDIAALSLGVLM